MNNLKKWLLVILMLVLFYGLLPIETFASDRSDENDFDYNNPIIMTSVVTDNPFGYGIGVEKVTLYSGTPTNYLSKSMNRTAKAKYIGQAGFQSVNPQLTYACTNCGKNYYSFPENLAVDDSCLYISDENAFADVKTLLDVRDYEFKNDENQYDLASATRYIMNLNNGTQVVIKLPITYFTYMKPGVFTTNTAVYCKYSREYQCPVCGTVNSPPTQWRRHEMLGTRSAKAVYTLKYDANGGSNPPTKNSIESTEEIGKVAVSEQEPTREHYKFIGWNTSADGSGITYQANDLVPIQFDFDTYDVGFVVGGLFAQAPTPGDGNSMILYAQWEPIESYKVVYEQVGDPQYGVPMDAVTPNDQKNYGYKEEVTLKENPITSWITSNGTSDGVHGTWTFQGWDKEDKYEIMEDTIIHGTWVFTPTFGKLVVSNTVSGDDVGKASSFTFIVTLRNEKEEPVCGTFGNITFNEKGEYTFLLKGGESKTLSELPAGILYSVLESDYSGYSVTVNNIEGTTATGNVIAGETATVVFHNQRYDKKNDKKEVFPIKVILKAEKILDGKMPDRNDFLFMMKDENGQVIQTKNNVGNIISFDELTFFQKGIYTYTLTEMIGTDRNINYDNTIYAVTITVTEDNQYQEEVSYMKNGEIYSGIPIFANTTRKNGIPISSSSIFIQPIPTLDAVPEPKPTPTLYSIPVSEPIPTLDLNTKLDPTPTLGTVSTLGISKPEFMMISNSVSTIGEQHKQNVLSIKELDSKNIVMKKNGDKVVKVIKTSDEMSLGYWILLVSFSVLVLLSIRIHKWKRCRVSISNKR